MKCPQMCRANLINVKTNYIIDYVGTRIQFIFQDAKRTCFSILFYVLQQEYPRKELNGSQHLLNIFEF